MSEEAKRVCWLCEEPIERLVEHVFISKTDKRFQHGHLQGCILALKMHREALRAALDQERAKSDQRRRWIRRVQNWVIPHLTTDEIHEMDLLSGRGEAE